MTKTTNFYATREPQIRFLIYFGIFLTLSVCFTVLNIHTSILALQRQHSVLEIQQRSISNTLEQYSQVKESYQHEVSNARLEKKTAVQEEEPFPTRKESYKCLG